MDKACDEFKLRFPFLSSLRLQYRNDDVEDLALFMGILLGTIERSRRPVFCFIFPRKGQIAPLTAVLYSLGRFALEFPKLAENYARRSFQKGERVKLRPSEKVFVFGGLWESNPSQFRLEIMNREGAAFTWPTSEILRIEATHRKIPHGQFLDADRLRHSVQLSDLDRLIGTRTFGNASLFETHVLYMGRQSEFQEFLLSTRLTTAGFGSAPALVNLVPIGSVTESGSIEHADQYNPQGQPFVAISSKIENIAAACAQAPPRSKVVIVDGAHQISDLGKFDRIFETQNIIILADETDEDKLRQLHDRGCKFWRFSAADLEIGGSRGRGSFFGPVYRAADNEASFATETIACENAYLEEVGMALETCERSLDESEGDETRRVLGGIYSVLTHCASLLQPPSPEQNELLRKTVSKLSFAADERVMWLPDAAAKPLTEACRKLNAAVGDAMLGIAKGQALTDLISVLRESKISRLGVVTRTAAQQMAASAWLGLQGLACPVLLPRSAGERGFFDAVICTSWPNALNFERLISQHVAPTIYLAAYPFERRWIDQFRYRRAHTQRVPSIAAVAKSELVGFPSDFVIRWPEPVRRPIHETATTPAKSKEFKIWDFEERIVRRGISRPAAAGEEMVATRLVTFLGDAYAFLTKSCKLPVITELVSGGVREGYAIPRRVLEAIHVDDVLVFREGGRRDVIHALADSALGVKATQIRFLAAHWQRALRESGLSDTELLDALQRVGCNRSLGVVRYWLADESMIGPQNETDVTAIAQATSNDELMRDAARTWQAIRVLRGEHQSAGMRLLHVLLRELPGRVGELRDGRTHIEIENTIGAWIVQVESIAEHVEARPRSQINTLLWDEDTPF
jgi:hypothetical protein